MATIRIKRGDVQIDYLPHEAEFQFSFFKTPKFSLSPAHARELLEAMIMLMEKLAPEADKKMMKKVLEKEIKKGDEKSTGKRGGKKKKGAHRKDAPSNPGGDAAV